MGPATLPGPIAIIGASPAAQALASALEATGTPVTAYEGLDALDEALDADGPVPALVLAGPHAPRPRTAPPVAAGPPRSAPPWPSCRSTWLALGWPACRWPGSPPGRPGPDR